MKNNYPPPATNVPKRVMWRAAKRKITAFSHVKVSIDGDADRVSCKRCETEGLLEKPGRTRQGMFLEFARKHYYRHKLDRTEL